MKMTDDLGAILEPRSTVAPSAPARELSVRELRDTIQEGVFRGAMKAVAVYGLIGVLVWMVAMLAGCSKGAPSGPARTDPSVLVVNLTGDNVKLIWATDSLGAVKFDTVIVRPNTTVCQRWTQSFDSLYTHVVDSSQTHPGAYADVLTPWVHFSQYPDYFQRDSILVSENGQNILITNRLDSVEC